MSPDLMTDHALYFASRGTRVLPCHGIIDGACTCGNSGCSSPGKHPLLRRGLHEATTDPETIEAWWRRWPHANLALRTGVVSDLVVLDIDVPDGVDSLRKLTLGHHPLPETSMVRTGSGGLHLYFLHPGGQVPNRASSVLGPGIDVRGDGGYVIAPPSRHVNGSLYLWHKPGIARRTLPTWLSSLLVSPPELQRATVDHTNVRADRGVSAWAGTALEREIARITAAPEGRRNETLNRSAFVLGQIVGGGHLDRDQVSDLLNAAGRSAGLGEHEVQRTVESGLSAGARLPRHPPERPRSQAWAEVRGRGIEL